MPCDAQSANHVPRIGIVSIGLNATRFAQSSFGRAFLEGMREQGYEQGRDFALDVRATQGRLEGYAELNNELARLPVDVLIAIVCGEPLNAARRATQTIPIVVPACTDDMVETGVIRSYQRPGGNVTGLSKLTPELASKRLELLKRIVPGMTRVAVLWNPDYSQFTADWRELRGAAERLGVKVMSIEYRRPEEFQSALMLPDATTLMR
jgi:putative ABC transport system substrate-binding protein